VKLGWSWYWSRNASKDLRLAQEEAENVRRAAEEYDACIAEAQIDLANMQRARDDLVSDAMWTPTIANASARRVINAVSHRR
jgi:hypothetical protein